MDETIDERGRTALHRAVMSRDNETTSTLIAQKPELITLSDKNGITPLWFAVTYGYVETVQLMIARDPASIKKYDSRRRSILHEAISKGFDELSQVLIAFRPEVRFARDQIGNSPLHVAADAGLGKIVDLLITPTPDIELTKLNDLIMNTNVFGNTAVHIAVYKQHEAIAETLLARAPSIVLDPGPINDSMLHVAIKNVSERFATKIFEMNKQALHVINRDGRTPYDLVIGFHGSCQLAKCMEPMLSFDEIVGAFKKCKRLFGAQVAPLVKELVVRPLSESLGQDLARMVGSYVADAELDLPAMHPNSKFVATVANVTNVRKRSLQDWSN